MGDEGAATADPEALCLQVSAVLGMGLQSSGEAVDLGGHAFEQLVTGVRSRDGFDQTPHGVGQLYGGPSRGRRVGRRRERLAVERPRTVDRLHVHPIQAIGPVRLATGSVSTVSSSLR